MNLALVWSNFVAYSLQIGLLVGVAALAPAALRLRSPRAKLAYWHLLLIACLFLPILRPWRQQIIVDTVSVTTRIVAIGPADAPQARTFSPIEIALVVLALGALARLGWLAAGFWKLGRYRQRSQPFSVTLPWPSRAELRLSADVSSPVTFGFREPVVLLPTQFPGLDPVARQAILCHELLHVSRADWLFTVAEELIRAFFWFHPAIWWLLGEIQLAREQAVDREVIALTQAKEEYVDALLAIAGARPQLDLAPASLFLRKRHLKHRVVSILKETRMSKSRLLSALAASVCVLVATCWLVTNTFPLAAAPQVVSDSPGVTVDVGSATLMHRAPVQYPDSARTKRVQGSVVLELTFDGSGNVADARVLSGPDDLRKAALQSALQWHFAREAAGAKRQVTIAFALAGTPEPEAAPTRPTDTPRVPLGAQKRTVKSIRVIGTSDQVRDELMAGLPVRVGNLAGDEEIRALIRHVRQYDEHLSVSVHPSPADELSIAIVAPMPNAGLRAEATIAVSTSPSEIDGQRIKVGGNIQSSKLIRQPRPVYPMEAKAARIQGVVKLSAVIAKDGTVKQLEVISGHPLLIASALDAVRQWVYETTLLNGNPVEVQTQIDVNYTLSQ